MPSREEIRAKIKSRSGVLQKEKVEVPWLPYPVLVRGMTFQEFQVHQTALMLDEDGLAVPRLLTKLIVDEQGVPVLEGDADVEWLGQVPLEDLIPFVDAVNRLSANATTPEEKTELQKEILGESPAQSSSS